MKLGSEDFVRSSFDKATFFFFVFFVKKIQITMFSQFMSLPLTKAKNGGPTQLGIEILPGQ